VNPLRLSGERSISIVGALLGLLALFLLVGLLLIVAFAAANFETVKTFKEEGHVIRKRTGLAINVNGVGGVFA
jgi:hypothetical protein